jgi:inner membrane protein
VQVDSQQKIAFSISLKIKGSSFLYFTPTGKTTVASVSSTWKHPSFDGQYLPSQPATVSENGFSAQWKILQVSRSYPQVWTDANEFDINKSAFGVKLLQPTDGYAKTQRSVKYAIMIIALTFTIFFFVEIFQKRRVHPLQYILVGIALCVFYTLLLSISEYIGFNGAYAIASLATVSLIGLYVLGIFKKLQIAAGFATALGALYTYIFVLIQLQDYALLFGSVGLFVILAVIMYFSRKIDWYCATETA